MRVAVLSDVHGNAPALEAVLHDVDEAEVDLIVFVGDVASGPLPRATLDILEGLRAQARFVRGNGDRYVVEAFESARRRSGPAPSDEWVAQRITRHDRDFLASFEPTVSVTIDGLGPTLFCHGSPRSDEEIITLLSPGHRLTPLLKRVAEAVVVCGHTHSQFDRMIGDHRIVNPGSVGMPYESRPGAYWAILGPDVDLRRTPYDPAEAAERIRAGGWPDAESFLAENLFSVPAAQEAAELFEGMAAEQSIQD